MSDARQRARARDLEGGGEPDADLGRLLRSWPDALRRRGLIRVAARLGHAAAERWRVELGLPALAERPPRPWLAAPRAGAWWLLCETEDLARREVAAEHPLAESLAAALRAARAWLEGRCDASALAAAQEEAWADFESLETTYLWHPPTRSQTYLRLQAAVAAFGVGEAIHWLLERRKGPFATHSYVYWHDDGIAPPRRLAESLVAFCAATIEPSGLEAERAEAERAEAERAEAERAEAAARGELEGRLAERLWAEILTPPDT